MEIFKDKEILLTLHLFSWQHRCVAQCIFCFIIQLWAYMQFRLINKFLRFILFSKPELEQWFIFSRCIIAATFYMESFYETTCLQSRCFYK